MEKFYQKYKKQGLFIAYILTENERPGSGQVSHQYCVSHAKDPKYSFSFDSYRDPGSVVMRQFFDKNAVPLNMLITTKDMKIRYKLSGALEERIEGLVANYLR